MSLTSERTSESVNVREFRAEEHAAWLRMRLDLWPHSDGRDADRWLSRSDAVTLVAENSTGELIGFAEAGERAYADGCDSSPVAFLEGWYAVPSMRRLGVGAKLVCAVEGWARGRNLTELASDALLDNAASIAAHLSTGFDEVERSVKFRKPLF